MFDIDPKILIGADPRVLGAALKIAYADVPEDRAQHVSGVSVYVWRAQSAEIMELAQRIRVKA